MYNYHKFSIAIQLKITKKKKGKIGIFFLFFLDLLVHPLMYERCLILLIYSAY